MEVTTKVRRTHLGPRYDIYVDGVYSATAYTAREIEPIVQNLELKYLESARPLLFHRRIRKHA